VNAGSISATGWESPGPGARFVLLLVGIVQFFPVLALSQFGGPYFWLYLHLFYPSVAVFVLFLIIAAYVSNQSTKKSILGPYSIEYTYHGNELGELELTYTNVKGVKRVRIAVKSVKIERIGMWRPGWGGVRRVEGLVAALRIKYKHRQGGLYLGFRSEQEMRNVYELLQRRDA
jgi:hypothetical protein